MIDLLIFPSLPFLSSPLMPLVIIACMWINDTMAYIVGSLIGKTPLTRISPKKTWEGTIGGIVLCVTVVAIASYYIPILGDISFIHWLMISAIAAIAGTFGDLLESKLKRMAQVKDSGSIMPGHGGFLDRFDSLLVAVPFVWLYIELFLR
jgi:phosphatidate cytidylyltransferase